MKQERIGRKNGMTRYGTKHPDSETGSRGRKGGGDVNWEAERRTGEDETRGENYIEKERTPEGAEKTREPGQRVVEQEEHRPVAQKLVTDSLPSNWGECNCFQVGSHAY